MNTGNAGKTGMGSCVGLQINRADCGKSGTPIKKPVFLKFPVFPVCALPRRSPQGEDGRPHRLASRRGYTIPRSASRRVERGNWEYYEYWEYW